MQIETDPQRYATWRIGNIALLAEALNREPFAQTTRQQEAAVVRKKREGLQFLADKLHALDLLPTIRVQTTAEGSSVHAQLLHVDIPHGERKHKFDGREIYMDHKGNLVAYTLAKGIDERIYPYIKNCEDELLNDVDFAQYADFAFAAVRTVVQNAASEISSQP